MVPGTPKEWAVIFHRLRLRKGWSYDRLAIEAGLSDRWVVMRACTSGHVSLRTATALAAALGIGLTVPAPILTAQQAQRG